MNEPNVNIKLLKMIQAEQSENDQHQLTDIGSCGLHTIHNAFKTRAESTGWRMKKSSREPTKFSMIHLLDKKISSL